MADRVFATTGRPPRIGGVHVDVIKVISRSRGFKRTTNTLETGAPLTTHRKRKAEGMTLEVVASDKTPIAGAELTPLWEFDHAAKVEARLLAVMASDEEIEVWDGTKFLETPEGKQVWVIDDIDDTITAPEFGVFNASIKIGESRRAPTAFTSALQDVDESLADVTGEPGERGRQSTSALSDADTAAVGGLSWPP